jgi:hypothetical protein
VTVPAYLFSCTYSPSTTTLFYMSLTLLYTWLRQCMSTPIIYTQCTVYLLLRHATAPAIFFPSTASPSPFPVHAYAHLWPYYLRLQLPNTSLNGGNVCLATLHSSDRDYNSSTSTFFVNIFATSSTELSI